MGNDASSAQEAKELMTYEMRSIGSEGADVRPIEIPELDSETPNRKSNNDSDYCHVID